jgi:hypothetical protein
MNRGRHRRSKQHLIVQILGKNIANRMMECQKEQGNIPNLDVFLNHPSAGKYEKGFTWSSTKEGHSFWFTQIQNTLTENYLYKKWKNDRR